MNGASENELTPRQVARGLRSLLDRGARLRPAGEARANPSHFLPRYLPRHQLELFDVTYFLTDLRHDDNIRFLVGYVALRELPGRRIRRIHPRIFYKDSSLLWRVATHFICEGGENWIGKGDVRWERFDGEDFLCTAEETTNLPLEIQAALDGISRKGGRARCDRRAVPLVLREAPRDRMEPYADFSRPRRRAQAAHAIHDGEPVAFFQRPGDPGSLRFVSGYEPDFKQGVVQEARSASRLYGGSVRKFRILSRNREIQYLFVAAPRHVWLNAPQSLTTEIMSYGVRTVDVMVPEELTVPGYEYHYYDDGVDPPELHSQIPEGYVGKVSKIDPSRSDASPWIERLPVIQRFRKQVLGRTRR